MATEAIDLSEDKGPKILAVLWSLTLLTLVMVLARIFIRIRMLRNFGSDDYLIVVSMILGLGYCVTCTIDVVSFKFGKHVGATTPHNMEMAILWNTISFLFGILSFSIPKLAIAAMLSRVLNPPPLPRMALWGLTGFAAVVSCICIVILFTMCDPPQALWYVHLAQTEGATCKSTTILIDYAYFTGALSAFTDLYLAIYPGTVLMKLQMSLKKRLALCAALGLGSIAAAMAIVKCTQLHNLAAKSDYTYATADLVMWTNIESNIVILASCIPTLQPLIEIILGKRKLSSYSNGNGYVKNYKGSSSGNFPSGSFEPAKRSVRSKNEITINDVESQENILENDGNKNQIQGRNIAMGNIRRTDHVAIEYETASTRHHSQGSW